MRLFREATLDKLEPRFIRIAPRRRKKPPPKWLMPTARLEPTQPYPFRDYVWSSLLPGLAADVYMVVMLLLMLFLLRYQHPTFFRAAVSHHGRAHAVFISLLSHYTSLLPTALVFYPAFNLLLYLPTWYFWNRRAARLRWEALQPLPSPPDPLPLDPTIWPPAPTLPPPTTPS